MVSSTHWLASQSAMAELEAGGNAFDAAIAGAFVLHVVEPHLNGPGGEVPAIFATADDPTPRVLCGQGTAPAGATREHYLGLGLDLVPGSGPLAAADPGGGRRLADAGPRPRHPPAARRPLLRDRVRARRAPAAADRGRDGGQGRAAVPGALADLGGTVAAPRRAAAPVGRRHQPRARRHAGAAGRGGRGRRRRPGGAVRRRAPGLARGVRGRGGRRVQPAAVPRLQRRRPRRRADRGRPRGLDARRTSRRSCSGSATSRSPRPTCGDRDRCCCSRWPCSTACPTRRSTRRPADGVHTITEVLKLAFADREAWYGDASPVTVGAAARPGVRRGAAGAGRATAPRPSCGRGRPAAASRCCPRTCGGGSERSGGGRAG